MTRRKSSLPLNEVDDMSSRLKPEKAEDAVDADLTDDSGDVMYGIVLVDVGDDAAKAVLRRRSDCRGCSGWRLREGMMFVVDSWST